MSARPSEILRKARELLEREGWIQGENHNAQGYCSWGAVREARDLLGATPFGTIAAWEQLGRAITSNASTMSPVIFNDLPGRRKEEVIEVFERAEASAREREVNRLALRAVVRPQSKGHN